MTPRRSNRFNVVGLIPSRRAASPMRIAALLMRVFSALSGSCAAIPGHIAPAVVREQQRLGTAVVLLPPQVGAREKLDCPPPCLLFVAREPHVALPDTGADSGMGEPESSQDAQPDAKTEPYREHAPCALSGHGLDLLDDHMALGACMRREERH